MSTSRDTLQAMIASARTPGDFERIMRVMMSPDQLARQEAFDRWQQLDAQYQAEFRDAPLVGPIGADDRAFRAQLNERHTRWAEVVAAKEAYEALYR